MEETSGQVQKVKAHTSCRQFAYTLVLVSVAVPRWRVPRPASQKTEHVTFHRGDGGNI